MKPIAEGFRGFASEATLALRRSASVAVRRRQTAEDAAE